METSILICHVYGHCFTAATAEALSAKVRRWIREECLGASDIGSKFCVRDTTQLIVGYLSYNGRYEAVA